MPVGYWLGAFNDQAYGRCDSCEEGSVTYQDMSIHLNSLHDDGEAPWYCDMCLDNHWESDSPRLRDYDRAENGDQELARYEEMYDFAKDHKINDPVLLLPIIPGRNSRLISCEQELGAGGENVASLLFSNKFSQYDEVTPYHSRDTPQFLARVEEDSSVDSEVIFSKMDLDNPQMARNFETALALVRNEIENGEAKLDMRCGFHVHVDLHFNQNGEGQFGMSHVESLYHLWNYLEDPIFRLSSANWQFHRTERAYHNYALRTPKNLLLRGQIGANLERERYAINFVPYFSARGYCGCGAFAFAAWEQCTCDLPKPTVEFRVFNGTANLRKIHAYTALSLALVEYAFNAPEYMKMEWAQKSNPFTSTEEIPIARTREGWEFILNELPLTDSEQRDLIYCAENSSLAKLI